MIICVSVPFKFLATMEESKLRKESIIRKIMLKLQDMVEIKCLEFGEVVMRKGCTLVRRLHLENTVQKHEAGGGQGLEIIGLRTESSNSLAGFTR